MTTRPRAIAAGLILLAASGCGGPTDVPGGPKKAKVGVAFETLQTEYWVASLDALRAELKSRDVEILESVADGDANRQLEQVNSFLAQGVDGLIVVPKDGRSIAPMIRAADKAGVPIVLYNRPPAGDPGKSVTVVADNRAITRATVEAMIDAAKKSGGGPRKAMILMGDLSDVNAIDRLDGFEDAVEASGGAVEVVSRIPTEWNQEKALAGVTNALQSHPEIDFLFSSSDFLFPSVVSALKAAGKYKKVGEPGHVTLGGFDGDATAYRMLADGYLDADGVQDVAFECKQAVDAVLKKRAGETVEPILRDPGFVIHQGNLKEEAPRMWGAKAAKP